MPSDGGFIWTLFLYIVSHVNLFLEISYWSLSGQVAVTTCHLPPQRCHHKWGNLFYPVYGFGYRSWVNSPAWLPAFSVAWPLIVRPQSIMLTAGQGKSLIIFFQYANRSICRLKRRTWQLQQVCIPVVVENGHCWTFLWTKRHISLCRPKGAQNDSGVRWFVVRIFLVLLTLSCACVASCKQFEKFWAKSTVKSYG